MSFAVAVSFEVIENISKQYNRTQEIIIEIETKNKEQQQNQP